MLLFVQIFVAAIAYAGLASASVVPRSSKLTFTIINKCSEAFAPVFSPSLPKREQWDVIQPGDSAVHKFRSDTYIGKVFAPLNDADVETGAGATQGEIDLQNGLYDITVANGFNVPMYLSLVGQQRDGYCQPAHCANAQCKDAYKSASGTLNASRVGVETVKPNHSCSPAYTQWIIQFC